MKYLGDGVLSLMYLTYQAKLGQGSCSLSTIMSQTDKPMHRVSRSAKSSLVKSITEGGGMKLSWLAKRKGPGGCQNQETRKD